MSFINRYSDIRRGGIVFTGNTLGLSKLTNANRAGVQGSIGAFTALDNSLQVNDFPTGTTFVANSVKIDGISQPGSNPAVGFALPNLAVGASTVVEFDVTVN